MKRKERYGREAGGDGKPGKNGEHSSPIPVGPRGIIFFFVFGSWGPVGPGGPATQFLLPYCGHRETSDPNPRKNRKLDDYILFFSIPGGGPKKNFLGLPGKGRGTPFLFQDGGNHRTGKPPRDQVYGGPGAQAKKGAKKKQGRAQTKG